MPRKTTVVGAFALVTAMLTPLAAPAETLHDHANRPTEANGYFDTTGTPQDIVQRLQSQTGAPTLRKNLAGGRVIEVYTSVGDIQDGNPDWHTVNAYSRLVASVPADKEIYSTVYNSLWDGKSVLQPTGGQTEFRIEGPTNVFGPTAAFLAQINQRTPQQRQQVHVLGSRTTMNEAWNENSSLARLLMSGANQARPARSGVEAVNYRDCARNDGGCLTVNKSRDLMHSKYAAFEQATDSQGVLHDHVVWITSSNLNGASGGRKSNTSIAIYGDRQAYESIVDDVFASQIASAPSMNNSFSPGYLSSIAYNGQTIPGLPTDSGTVLYSSPRATSKLEGNDAAVQRVDVEAKYLADRDTAGAKTNCKVYTVHSLFNRGRSGVLERLASLENRGCDVKIVLGTNAVSSVVDAYFAMSTDLRETIDHVEFANVHDKTLTYVDSTHAAVFGGSANLTVTSLEFDELSFRTEDRDVATAVAQHSERLWQLARGRTKWAKPTSVAIAPESAVTVAQGGTVKLSTRVAPANALVTGTLWESKNPGVATVDDTGLVRGIAPGSAVIEVKAQSANGVEKTTQKTVQVTAGGSSSAGAAEEVTIAPVLTVNRYQSPTGKTPFVVTWGSGNRSYEGVVKLQYYSGGWKTYKDWIYTDKHGNGWKNAAHTQPAEFNVKSSKTWRAYGARVDGVWKNGQRIADGVTTKTKSTGLSYLTVRTKTSNTTPRLYATSLVKAGDVVPMLVGWNYSSGTFRVQYKSGTKWKTHSTFSIDKGGNQALIGFPISTANTKTWRIATSSGALKTSNSVKIKAIK